MGPFQPVCFGGSVLCCVVAVAFKWGRGGGIAGSLPMLLVVGRVAGLCAADCAEFYTRSERSSWREQTVGCDARAVVVDVSNTLGIWQTDDTFAAAQQTLSESIRVVNLYLQQGRRR